MKFAAKETMGRDAEQVLDLAQLITIIGLYGVLGLAAGTTMISCSGFGGLKPNQPYIGVMPPSYNVFIKHNPALAQQILLLPDIIDGVDGKDIEGLNRWAQAYIKNKEKFDQAFEDTQNMGFTHIRPYDSVLESLLWIYKRGRDQNVKATERIIQQWGTDKETAANRAHMGIDAEGIYSQAWFGNQIHPEKWTYNKVKQRMSSDIAISYYTIKLITYEKYFTNRKSNRTVCMTERANCYDESEFIVELLQGAGYPARLLPVEGSTTRGHILVGYIKNGMKYIMNNGRPGGAGIEGPFKRYRDSKYTFLNIQKFGPID